MELILGIGLGALLTVVGAFVIGCLPDRQSEEAGVVEKWPKTFLYRETVYILQEPWLTGHTYGQRVEDFYYYREGKDYWIYTIEENTLKKAPEYVDMDGLKRHLLGRGLEYQQLLRYGIDWTTVEAKDRPDNELSAASRELESHLDEPEYMRTEIT